MNEQVLLEWIKGFVEMVKDEPTQADFTLAPPSGAAGAGE